MANVLTQMGSVRSRRANQYTFRFVPGNNTYPTGGDTIDFTAAVISPGAAAPIPGYPPQQNQVTFLDTCAGYIPEWVVGSTLHNAKIKFYSSAGVELANATYPAPMQADNQYFTVTIPRGISQ